MALKFISKNEKDTINSAKQFAKKLRGGEVLLLLGDLGSGKTTFVKGLAQGLGIKEKITSPTFILLRQNKIRNPKSEIRNFIHVDAYRLGNGQDLFDIGLGDWLGRPDTIAAVEWGEKLKPILKKHKVIQIQFKYGKKDKDRIIQMKSAHP